MTTFNLPDTKILVAWVEFPLDAGEGDVRAEIYRDHTVKWYTPQGRKMAERLRPESFASSAAFCDYCDQFVLTTKLAESDYWPLVEYFAASSLNTPTPDHFYANARAITQRLYRDDAAPLIARWIN